jgi:hypothetical protein
LEQRAPLWSVWEEVYLEGQGKLSSWCEY